MSTPYKPMFARFDGEWYLYRRLSQHDPHLFIGVTDDAVRQERMQRCILTHGLADVEVPGSQGKDTYRTAFERLYGDPLEREREIS